MVNIYSLLLLGHVFLYGCLLRSNTLHPLNVAYTQIYLYATQLVPCTLPRLHYVYIVIIPKFVTSFFIQFIQFSFLNTNHLNSKSHHGWSGSFHNFPTPSSSLFEEELLLCQFGYFCIVWHLYLQFPPHKS